MTNTMNISRQVAREAQARALRLFDYTSNEGREDWVEQEAWERYRDAVASVTVWAVDEREVCAGLSDSQGARIHAASILIYVLDICEVDGVELGVAAEQADVDDLTAKLTW